MGVCYIQRNGWIPVAFSTLLSIGIILSFILAYARDAVKTGFPHISDTAAQQPQSGIFCIFLFLSAFTAFMCMAVRYASVSEANVNSNMAVNVINKLSLLFGAVSLGGMMVVGAYPLSDPPAYIIRTEWKNISRRPHSIAAVTLFSCVNVYCALHTVLTVLQRKREGIVICCLRIALFVMTVCSFIVMKIHGMRHAASKNCKECSENTWNENGVDDITANVTHSARPKETGELTDFDKSAISELALAVFLVIYFLTFAKEFSHISLTLVTKHETEPRSLKPSKQKQMVTQAV